MSHIVPFILFQASIILLASTNVPRPGDPNRPWVIGALVILEALAIANLVVGVARAQQRKGRGRTEE